MPISYLSATPVDGLPANYSQFQTLASNDLFINSRITRYTIKNTDGIYYDESDSVRIRCGKVRVTVPANSHISVPKIKIAGLIPVHPQVTVEGHYAVRSVIQGVDADERGFTVILYNENSNARTVTIHWMAICLDPLAEK